MRTAPARVPRVFRTSVLLLGLLAFPAAAEPPIPDAGPPEARAAPIPEPEIPVSEPPELALQDFDLGWTLFRTFMVLVCVVGLAWLTLNVGLRRLLGIKSAVGTSLVTVLERVPLDQKRTLFVVEAAGEVLLIGGGDGALSLLSRLPREEVDRLRTAAPVQVSPFLQKLLGRKTPSPQPPDEEEAGRK